MIRRKDEKVLRPVHPNAGIEADFRKKLYALVEEMHSSFDYWIKAAYRKNEPAIAQDATPAAEIQDEINRLAKKWQRRFNAAAPELAAYFARRASRRSDAVLERILRDAGISVRFQMSAAMRDILRATIEQNVSLIKSIPQQYLTQVQGEVMRSVSIGRDLGSLAKALTEQYGVTKRRAAFIARSQNNLATASMSKVRQLEVGIDEAVWLHSHGGREPRPTHVANSGKRYKIQDGWFDPHAYRVKGGGWRGEWIWPGQLPNCKCVAKPIVKGFS